jgi:hypothetical protein
VHPINFPIRDVVVSHQHVEELGQLVILDPHELDINIGDIDRQNRQAIGQTGRED